MRPLSEALVQAVRNVPVETRVRIAGLMAEAFQGTSWWRPMPLLALAIIRALILRRRPRAVAARSLRAGLELRETGE